MSTDSSDLPPDVALWLQEIGLERYLEEARVWMDREGAADLEDFKSEWVDLANHLKACGLTGKELASLQRACSHEVKLFRTSSEQYALLDKLGNGATASVYRCRREGDGDVFAAKVIDLKRLRHKPDYEQIMAKISQEANILRKLRHDGIVDLHDRVQTDDSLYIVMELVEGCDFQTYLFNQPEQRLDEEEARFVFKQLAEALKYIHDKNIIHRDLKLDNILVDEAWSLPNQAIVKITDFGQSKTIRDGYTRAESHAGAPIFEAPEVGKGPYDDKADLWSLGLILFFMLSGHLPVWEGDTKEDRKKKFSFKGNQKTEEVVRGLIQVNPVDRMSLAMCLRSSWLSSASLSMNTPGVGGNLKQPIKIKERVPRMPTDLKEFKKKLQTFGDNHNVATSFEGMLVVLELAPSSPAESNRRVREELLKMLGKEYPDMNKQLKPQEHDTLSAAHRREELAALEDEYGEHLEVLCDTEWRIWISRDPDNALRVVLPAKYPRVDPPRPEIECASPLRPGFSEDDLVSQFQPGDACIYQWVEEVRDAIIMRR